MIHYFLRIFLFLFSFSAVGQVSLSEAFSIIESQSKYTFNFQKDSVDQYTFNGDFKEEFNAEFFKKLLRTTPYEFQITDLNEVLIFRAPQMSLTLCGTVRDLESGEVLPFASINVFGTAQGTESDINGDFEIKGGFYKNQTLQVSYLGYKTLTLDMIFFESSECRDVLIEKNENILAENVVITDYILKDISRGKEYGSFNYDYKNFTKRKSSLESDVLRSLQFLPGINSTDDSATNLNIRGASADQSVVLWENAPLYNPGHMFGMISSINPFVVDQVDLYKDIFHPKYDNRVGSLIDISLNDKVVQKPRMGLGMTFTEAHFFVETPIISDKVSLIVSGRKSIFDLFQSETFSSYSETLFQNTKIEEQQTEVLEGDREAQNNLEFYDINAKVILNPTEKLNLTFAHFRSENDFRYVSEDFYENISSEDIVEYNVEVSSGTANYLWNENHETTLDYSSAQSQNSLEFSLNDEESSSVLSSATGANDIKDISYNIMHRMVFKNDYSLSLGYNYDSKEVGFALAENSPFEEDFDETSRTSGQFHNTYGAFEITKKKWYFNGSLKATNQRGSAKNYYSPRLHLQYDLTDHLSASITTGRTYQFINQLQEFGGFELNLNGNIWILRDLGEDGPLEAEKAAIGLIYKKRGWLVDISGYRNETQGLSLLQSRSLGVDGDFLINGESTSTGIDLLVNKNWSLGESSRLESWMNYSLNENDYLFSDISDDQFPATIHQRHTFKLVNKLNLKKLQLMFTYHYKTGLPFSRPIGFMESDPMEEDFEIEYAQINGARLPDYRRIDIGATYLHQLSSFNFEISFSMLNILNDTNILSRTAFIDEGENEEPLIFTAERRLLRRTPLLMVRVFF